MVLIVHRQEKDLSTSVLLDDDTMMAADSTLALARRGVTAFSCGNNKRKTAF